MDNVCVCVIHDVCDQKFMKADGMSELRETRRDQYLRRKRHIPCAPSVSPACDVPQPVRGTTLRYTEEACVRAPAWIA